MPELHTLLVFGFAVFALLLSPGPNMAFLLAHSATHGPRGGLAVALGIFAADLSLSALTALGVTSLVMAMPGSFDALRLAGAAYLLWLAWHSLHARGEGSTLVRVERGMARVVAKACTNSLLNPKALVFFVVFLPPFVDPARPPVSTQLAVLGAVLSVEALLFHALLGLVSGAFGRSVGGTRGRIVMGRVQAFIFVALAARLMAMAPSTAGVS